MSHQWDFDETCAPFLESNLKNEDSSEEMQCYEFCTYEIPEAFLSGVDTNLRRLASKADCLCSQPFDFSC
ncbi:hypothetical protein Tco_0411938 [Tanacetum coccineum]